MSDPIGSPGFSVARAGISRTGLEITAGLALDWHEPGWGTFIHGAPHAFATREITAIGSSDQIGELGAPTLWQGMRQAADGVLSGAALMPGCDALELRYIAVPQPSGRARVRIFVTAKARDWSPVAAEAAVEAACRALPPGFDWGISDVDLRIAENGSDLPLVELRRLEEVTLPHEPQVTADYFYGIYDSPGDGSGWQRFWLQLAEASQPVIVSVLFKPTDLHWQERDAIGALLNGLARDADARTDYDVVQNVRPLGADISARMAFESWQQRVASLQRPVLARLAVRGSYDIAVPVASALAASIAAQVSDDGMTQPMHVEAPSNDKDQRQAAHGFDWLEILPWGGHPLWDDEIAPHTLRRLPYLYGISEAARLAVLPVPDVQGVPGVQRARRTAGRRSDMPALGTAAMGGPSVTLGAAIDGGRPGGPVNLPIESFTRHVLTVGEPGSGKTTTVLSLITRLWREHQVPFLVIEPTKKEYRSLLGVTGMNDLQVICLGRDDLSPLRLNPLAPPPGVRREAHAGAVLASLAVALPLFDPLPQLLEVALDRVYEDAGWDYDTIPEEGIRPPTLRDLLRTFTANFEAAGYVGDARNIGTAFDVRLRSLLAGTKGRVLDTVESVDVATLLTRPVIIELDELANPEEKSIIATLLLDRIRAAARARGSTGGQLKHLTVIEEAHRLLPNAAHATGSGGESPPSHLKAITAFCTAIAELRAQGEGFVLSSQLPAELAPTAVANTGTRVLHRLESDENRRGVLDDFDASALDREAAARLRKGEALVRWPEQDEVEIVQVVPAEGVDSGRNVPDDAVRAHMDATSQQTRALLPHTLCTRKVCTLGCDPARRRDGRLLARDAHDAASQLWVSRQPRSVDALPAIADDLMERASGDVPLAYCGATHLSADAVALNVARRRDIRPDVARALEEALIRYEK